MELGSGEKKKNRPFQPKKSRLVQTEYPTVSSMKFKRRVVQTEYPTRLQLYKTPPVQTIGLQEFEELALQRLKCECIGDI